MRIVLTGSYNGQDSLGDECLLKAVVEKIRNFSSSADVYVQLHSLSHESVRSYLESQNCGAGKGLQSAVWRMSHVLQRLRVPRKIANLGSEVGILIAARLRLFGAHEVVDRLNRADAFFVYGGTQFSGKWFNLNAPAYLKSAKIVKRSGGRVYFGPQQYGPLCDKDVKALTHALTTVVNDWRTRSPADVNLLVVESRADYARELYDEVFSAVRLYPSLRRSRPRHILINLRAMTFDDEGTISPERYRRLAELVDRLVAHYDAPAVFFAVSDSSFCNDDATFDAIQKMSNAPDRLTTVGRLRDEFQLFRLAQEAYLSLSMSFHGCLLSGIAGCPFIPVSEGDYYEYKYIGFDKYTGGQGTPIISLSHCDVDRDFGLITRFIESYDPEVVSETRELASCIADRFYQSVLG